MTALLNLRDLSPASHRPMPVSRANYERMEKMGMFAGRRVELINGVILEMNSMGEKHKEAIRALNRALVPAVMPTFDVLPQVPAAESEYSSPEPDFAIVPHGIPLKHIAIVPLVIEVSDSTLKFDLGTKAQLYAGAKVPEYWVVDLKHRVTVVHTAPRRGKYTKLRRVAWAEQLTSHTVAGLSLRLDELLS